MSIHTPPSSEESAFGRNLDIVSRFKAIMPPLGTVSTSEIFKSRTGQTITLSYDVDSTDFNVDLGLNVPPGLELPVFSIFHIEMLGVGTPQKTVHGEMPEFVIDRKHRFFLIRNYYFFDTNGHAVLSESIANITGGSRDDISRVAFIPLELNENDSRDVPLTADDYEKIEGWLKDIAEGRYTTPKQTPLIQE